MLGHRLLYVGHHDARVIEVSVLGHDVHDRFTLLPRPGHAREWPIAQPGRLDLAVPEFRYLITGCTAPGERTPA
jgi:hypothetical protein